MPAWRLALQPGQLSQVFVRAAKHRALECLRQRQVMRGREHGVQQGNDVPHLGRRAQVGFFGLIGRNVQFTQGILHGRQADAFARQHHDV